ncbi:aquaporin PIP1-2 [Iris pallida]|uniref:Aquaporin PIP1-2 n=1 Tax=Iris pallida TaxID=29817 RepID=A0AAX6GQM4_IRIPA|nr:aquaporin PIP1-2 [Iris pallida]
MLRLGRTSSRRGSP